LVFQYSPREVSPVPHKGIIPRVLPSKEEGIDEVIPAKVREDRDEVGKSHLPRKQGAVRFNLSDKG
jgi:hypothetical protein